MIFTFYITTTVLVLSPFPSSSQPTLIHNSERTSPLMGRNQILAHSVEADPSIVYKTTQCMLYHYTIEHEVRQQQGDFTTQCDCKRQLKCLLLNKNAK